MKHLEVPTRTLSAVLMFLVVLGTGSAAWAIDALWISAVDGDWNAGANWQSTFPPAANFNEAGVINNATATLSQHAKSDIPGFGFIDVDVAGLRLGNVAGQSGGLRVNSGGNLPIVAATGEAGAIQVGINATGTGTLTIVGGGTVTGVSLTSGGAPNSTSTTGSSIVLGDTTANTATLTLSGTANLQRRTRVIGPNVNFSAGGNLTLSSSHILEAEIRNATTHSPLKSGATASINGTLKPNFVGVTPTLGNKWNLIDAVNITGTFSSIDTSAAPSLAAGQAYQVITANGGMNGKLLQLSIEEILTLNVNRSTGAVSIANVGTLAKTIDGYSILSPSGSLNPANGAWNSLDDQNVGGANVWQESGPTAIALSELSPQGSSTINGGGSLNLGTPYTQKFPAFGQDPDDVAFEYSTTDGKIINGSVVYSGTKVINDLILTVNPATGATQLKNDSPYDIFIDGYAVYSTSGSLQPANGSWNSLDDQNITGWEEAGNPAPTANVVSELRADGSLRLSAGSGYSLGNLAKSTAGGLVQDLRLEFLQAGLDGPTEGQVFYGALPSILAPTPGAIGDYNGNGTVDAADYVLWRNHQGTNTVLANDPIGGTLGAAQYTQWRANFGRTAVPGAGGSLTSVPEPASAMLLLLAVAAMGAVRRSRSS